MRTTRRTARIRAAAVAVSAMTLLGATACSDAGSEEPEDESSSSAPAGDETTDEPTDDASAEPSGDAGGHPSWALPPTTPGEKLTTVEAGDVTVDVYQVAIDTAGEDGRQVDPDTDKPILAKGDKLVVLNYVITNHGDPIQLGSSKVGVDARYDDWKWLGGMGGLTDDVYFDKHGVNEDKNAPGGLSEDNIYVLGSGETYSYGENFEHQASSPITFKVRYTPVDAEGELLHDERVEAEGTATLT